MKLTEKLLSIQTELNAPKNLYNSFGKYHYRNAEGIFDAVKPLLKKYGVSLTVSDETYEVAGIVVVNATATIRDLSTEETIDVTSQAGVELSKKGMDLSQSFGASSSYARKYALNGLFLIDDVKDADSTNTHGKDEKPKAEKNFSKLVLKEGTADYDKVKLFLDKGGDIAKVEGKYMVSEELKSKLINK